MKKLLILGCSFSQGSFGENLAWAEGKSSPDPKFQFLQRSPKILEDGSSFYEDIIKDSLGWYHFVDMIKEFETTVFSFPGNGYSMWAQFLNIMADVGKLEEYDSIIIQESWEPRTCFCDILQLEEYVKNDLIKLAEYLGLKIVDLRSCHCMLYSLPPIIRPFHIILSKFFPGWRDSWLLVAKKPEDWSFRKEPHNGIL